MSTSPLQLAVNGRDPEEIRVVLHHGALIQDLRWSHGEQASLVGNVYLGEVRQVESGLDAAFVDFGGRRSGFLHHGNIHPGYGGEVQDPFVIAASPSRTAADLEDADEGADAEPAGEPPEAFRLPPIDQLLRPGQRVLVQIQRDPVRGKGATLTTYPSLAGRLVVLVPSLDRIGVSRRIMDLDERNRLREAVEEQLEGARLGVIVRTAAVGASAEALGRDLAPLLQQWREIGEQLAGAEQPGLLAAEASAAARAVRELFSDAVEAIVVDDEERAAEVEAELDRYVPGHGLEVRRYRGGRPLFEELGLERDWQQLFRPRVPIGQGASIVVSDTEALTAIDVNSGRLDRGSLEQTAFETNKLAAVEIARQIRLRDLGGILVVDFIDMLDAAHRLEVEEVLHTALQHDRARLKVGRMASFGLLPLTRRRQGAGLATAADHLCRGCGGSGSVQHHHSGALRLLRRMRAAEPSISLQVRAQAGVIAVLQEFHAATLEALGHRLTWIEDSQVPAGESVLEVLAAPTLEG